MDGDCRVDNIKCAICYDTANCDSIELKCGHAFGKSCMQKWLARNDQKNCHFCRKELTDIDLKKIGKIPLHERMVVILERTIKFIRETVDMTVDMFVHPNPSLLVGIAGGATATLAAVVADENDAGIGASIFISCTIGGFVSIHEWERQLTVELATGFATGVATFVSMGKPAAFSLAAVSVVKLAANYLVRNH
ncbi:RING finger domain-containing protein [Endozoicomonas sp. ALB032]|uniref:RING finger domain-containing protein n=1 Tax=Endozoicomonas sp. ALB032 TaxID=3403082 RepID=UPI003BB62B04